MAHYAQVEDGVVTKVIVAEQDFVDGIEGVWLQTSYNTSGGVHTLGGTPLRKNFAGVGMIYDAGRDAFYQPQPYPSWTLDESTCYWKAPVEYPPPKGGLVVEGGTGEETNRVQYVWDEPSTNWIVVT